MSYDDITEEFQTEAVACAKALGQKHAGALKEQQVGMNRGGEEGVGR